MIWEKIKINSLKQCFVVIKEGRNSVEGSFCEVQTGPGTKGIVAVDEKNEFQKSKYK